MKKYQMQISFTEEETKRQVGFSYPELTLQAMQDEQKKYLDQHEAGEITLNQILVMAAIKK